MASEKRVTIYDIAKAAGVSTATVTRVMSGQHSVRPQTRENVKRIIEQMGYAPSAIARGLENGRSRTIGLITPDITNPYFATLLSAASDEAFAQGYSIWLYPLTRDRIIDDNTVNELIRQRLEGVFFIGGVTESGNENLHTAITRLGQYMPIVALCPPSEGLGCICLYNDLIRCTGQAVRHLNQLGHKRMAFIGGLGQMNACGARGQGFLRELRELGLPDDPEYCHEAGFDAESGERAIMRLLSGMPRGRWPTAVIAFNDLVALGAMGQLKRMGLCLPDDMAIIGCDNQFFCSYTDPPLTSMDLHAEVHARSAVRELLAARGGTAVPFYIVHEATLVVRESCGAKLGRREFN